MRLDLLGYYGPYTKMEIDDLAGIKSAKQAEPHNSGRRTGQRMDNGHEYTVHKHATYATDIRQQLTVLRMRRAIYSFLDREIPVETLLMASG